MGYYVINKTVMLSNKVLMFVIVKNDLTLCILSNLKCEINQDVDLPNLVGGEKEFTSEKHPNEAVLSKEMSTGQTSQLI